MFSVIVVNICGCPSVNFQGNVLCFLKNCERFVVVDLTFLFTLLCVYLSRMICGRRF